MTLRCSFHLLRFYSHVKTISGEPSLMGKEGNTEEVQTLPDREVVRAGGQHRLTERRELQGRNSKVHQGEVRGRASFCLIQTVSFCEPANQRWVPPPKTHFEALKKFHCYWKNQGMFHCSCQCNVFLSKNVTATGPFRSVVPLWSHLKVSRRPHSRHCLLNAAAPF